MSTGNPITAGFIGCRAPNLSSLSCIEISHFSKRCAGRCDKNQISRRIEAVVTRLTRNQFDSNVTWVRIPPSAPKATPCGVLLFIFATNYARDARWDSNSPCPALCVPPGCNSPADCCKGAGESHRLRQVSPLNFTLGSDFFIAALQNPRAFLIDISPLFSSSDFRVRYKSYQQSRQIAIHRTTQDSSRSLGTN